MEEEDFDGDNLANLVVTRTGDYSEDLTVNYLVSGTAKKTDYLPLSGSVLIPVAKLRVRSLFKLLRIKMLRG